MSDQKRTHPLAARLKAYKDKVSELSAQIATITHDLKNPLAIMSESISLIESYVRKSQWEKLPVGLDFQRKAVLKMTAMLDALLSYSQIGRYSEKTQRVNLRETLINLHNGWSAKYPNLIAAIVLKLAAEELELPAVSIERVFTNLIENSFKYACPAGRLIITIELTVTNARLHFNYRDNGVGIPGEFSKRIFQVFTRASPNSPVKGYGIGMASVKKIVENLGGEIRIPEGTHAGVHFVIDLPRFEPAAGNHYA